MIPNFCTLYIHTALEMGLEFEKKNATTYVELLIYANVHDFNLTKIDWTEFWFCLDSFYLDIGSLSQILNHYEDKIVSFGSSLDFHD